MAKGLVVGAIIVDSLVRPTRVLAARRSGPADLRGFWEYPGGKVEPGEDVTDALVREVSEELGVALSVGDELAHPDGAWSISDRWSLRLFLAEVNHGVPTPDESHDEVRWLTGDELSSVSWLPADEAALGDLRTVLATGSAARRI